MVGLRAKIAMNQGRDADTDALLIAAGWLPLRVWEHEDPVAAGDRVETAWRCRTGRAPRAGR